MTSEDLEEWMLFDREEPIGPREERVQRAELASMIHNRWRGKRDQASTRDDFLLQPAKDPEQAVRDRQRHMIESLRAIARPAAERPRHRKHSKDEKRRKSGKHKP